MSNENSGGDEGIYSPDSGKALAKDLQEYLRKQMPTPAQVCEELGVNELDVAQSTAVIWFEMFKNNFKALFANIGPENVEEIFIAAGSWLEMLDAFGLYEFADNEDAQENFEN